MNTYRSLGPGQQICTLCGARISKNALARAGHERGKQHQEALAAAEARANKARKTAK